MREIQPLRIYQHIIRILDFKQPVPTLLKNGVYRNQLGNQGFFSHILNKRNSTSIELNHSLICGYQIQWSFWGFLTSIQHYEMQGVCEIENWNVTCLSKYCCVNSNQISLRIQ